MKILEPKAACSWQEYLAASGVSGRDAQDEFHRQLKGLHQRFDLVAFPPPVFDAQYIANVGDVAVRLIDILRSLPERIFGDDFVRMLEFQGVEGAEKNFIASLCTPRLLSMATQFARPDILVSNHGFTAVELNVGPPIGGLGSYDRVAREFLKTPYCEYLKSVGIQCRTPNMMEVWRDALMGLIRTRPVKSRPLFFEAVVDTDDLARPFPGHGDFIASVREFGFEVATGMLQELRIGTEGIYWGNRRVDVIYSMFAYAEVVKLGVPAAVISALATADQANLVDYISPPVNVLFDNKANLELLTAPRFKPFFSADEWALLQRHVAPTQRMRRELFDEVLECQAAFVLKPTSSFGGASVSMGEDLSRTEWEQRLHDAIDGPVRFVVQRRVVDAWLFQPQGSGGNVHFVCLGPAVFGHRYAGSYLRLAASDGRRTPVINVAQGAQASVAMVAEPLSI